jgi:hypothetical protein
MSEVTRFEVYKDINNSISHSGAFNTFDEAVVSFFEGSSDWAKIIVATPSMTCVKAYGGKQFVSNLQRINFCTATNLGGDSEMYEVYWHVWSNNPNILYELCNTKDAASKKWDDIGGDWAKIIVRTRDNVCVQKYGNEDVVQMLLDIAYC